VPFPLYFPLFSDPSMGYFLLTCGRDNIIEAEREETTEDHGANEAPVPGDEDLHALVDEEGGKWICRPRRCLLHTTLCSSVGAATRGCLYPTPSPWTS
jgi:hypothetical protein